MLYLIIGEESNMPNACLARQGNEDKGVCPDSGGCSRREDQWYTVN